jgi:flagellar basal-body rod modification protein FlgD
MINFDSINGATTTTTTEATTGELDTLGNDEFLKLFLAELKHQDPLEPMDASAMLDSTLQMSTIESNTKQTETLDDILTSISNPDQSQYINMIDNNIIIDNSTVDILGGTGQFTVNMPDSYDGTVDLIDSEGKVVSSKNISGEAGINYINFQNVPNDGIFDVKFNVVNGSNEGMVIDSNKFNVKGVRLNNGEIEYKVADDFYINNNSVKEYIS